MEISRQNMKDLELNDLTYPVDGAQEHFLSFVTPEDKIASFFKVH
jgi:hypothetical protein